jgi:hypothetical protein
MPYTPLISDAPRMFATNVELDVVPEHQSIGDQF